MLKNVLFAATMSAALTLGACNTANTVTKPLGVETVNVYSGAKDFQDRAYVTIRSYEAALDAALTLCGPDNPKAKATPQLFCETAAAAATRVSPAVEAAAHTIGTYVYLDSKVDEFTKAGKVVPADVLAAAAEAFYKANREWTDVDANIKAFIAAQ